MADLHQISRNYMKLWNAKNSAKYEKHADEKLTVYYTHFEKKLNRKHFFESLKVTHDFYPDMKIKIKSIDIIDRKSIVLWSYIATFTNGEMFGVKANKQKVEVSGVTFLEFKNGKVVKETGIVDNLSVLFQLGALKNR